MRALLQADPQGERISRALHELDLTVSWYDDTARPCGVQVHLPSTGETFSFEGDTLLDALAQAAQWRSAELALNEPLDSPLPYALTERTRR